MSISIKINAGSDEPFAVDIERFPTLIKLEKANSPLESLPFGLFLLVFLYIALSSFAPSFAFAVLMIAGFALLVLAFLLVRRSERKNIMAFDKNSVAITEAGLFKDHQWTAQYTDFASVQLRQRKAKSGRTQTTYQIIELKHSDDKKTLPLYVHKTKNAPIERWNSYAELFDLPATRAGV